MRNDKERIVDRRVLPGSQATAQMGVYAKPVDISTAAPQGELAALMGGLNAFTGSVVRKQDAQDKFDAKEAELSGALAGQMEQDANATVAGYYPTRDLPTAVNPAFKEHFDVAYRNNVAARVAASASDRFLADYEKQRFSEGFNAQQFLQDSRAKEMAGVVDPMVQGAVLKAHEDAAKVVLGDQRQIAFKRLVETETQNINQMVSSALPADLLSGSPETARAAISGIQAQARKTGLVSTQQVSELVTHHAVAQAIKHGDPRYLDVLDSVKDPATGMTLVDMNQQLKHSVESARKTATSVFDRKMDESMQGQYAERVMQLRADAEQGKLPDFRALREEVLGEGKMHRTMEQYLGMVEDLRRRAASVEDISAARAMFRAGQSHNITDPALLKKVLAAETAPIVSNLIQAHDAFTQAPTAANEGNVLTLYSQLMGYYAKTKDAPPQLKALFAGVANDVLSKDGQPTANLRIAQKLYGSMTPGQRDSMLDDSSKEFMAMYVAGLDNGATPVAALRSAREGMTDQGKALAARLKEDPSLPGRINSEIRSMQSNSLFTWATTRMGFIAENSKGNVFDDVKLNVMQRARMEPLVASRSGQLEQWAQSYLERNYVKDPVSNMLIKTTTSGMDAGTMGKVLEYQHAQWRERPDLKHVYADGGFVVATPTRGDTFIAESYTKEGIKLGLVGEFRAGEVSRSMSLTAPDGKPTESARLLGEFRLMQREGKLTREYLDKNAAGLASLRVQGHLDSGVLSDVTAKMATAEALSGPKSIPKFSIGKPDATKFEPNATGFARGDTLVAAQDFAASGRSGLALTATREGFVATATVDPNKSAGNNIGFGYNLKSKSAEQIKSDFKAAGIPEERVQDVVSGKAAITLDQGKRLLEVTHRRYAADAAANYPHGPNKWALLPQNIRDVLTDINYQTGNVAQFKQAVKALEAGNIGQLNEMLKVHYRTEDGAPFKADVRGNNLRAHLLESSETFRSALSLASKRPSTRLDSLAAK